MAVDLPDFYSSFSQQEEDNVVSSLPEETADNGLPDFYSSFSSTGPDLSRIDTSRKVAYGAAQETMIGGNLWRLMKTLTTDKTWEDLENERQREIDKEFTEFIGLQDQEEDAAVISGRLGTAIADPVTWMIPWAKVAKAGKIASTAAGAGVGVGETVLRESMTKGEVSGTNVAIAAVAGSAGGYLNAVLSKVPNKDKVTRILDDVEPEPDVVKPSVLVEGTKEAEESLAAVPPMRDVIRGFQREKWFGEPAPVDVTTASPMRDLIRAHNRMLGGFNQPAPRPAVILTKEEAKDLDTVQRFVGAQTNAEGKVTQSVFSSETIESLRVADKQIKDLEKKIARMSDKSQREIAKATLQDMVAKRDIIISKAGDRAVELVEEVENINIKALEKLSAEGKLTDGLMVSILNETARPMLGAAAAFPLGVSQMEDSDDYGTLIGYTAAGAGLGTAWRAVNRSETLTSLQKDKANEILINNGNSLIRQTLNRWTGASIPTKLKTDGGWNKVLGRLMYSSIGDASDSLEARMIRAQDDYTDKLFKIYGESVNDDVVSVLVGESLRGFVDPRTLKVGYRGIAGSLNPVTAEQIKEVNRIVPLAQQARDEIAETVSAAGIRYKVEDDYGLAQRYNFDNAQNAAGLQKFRQDLAEALRIQNKGKAVPDEEVDRVYKGLIGDRPLRGAKQAADNNNVFVRDDKGNFKFRRLADYFEQTRRIKDKDAVKYLAERGWLNLDSKNVLLDYGSESIKVAEFSKTFGANGELVNFALDASAEAFNKANRIDEGAAYNQRLIDAVEVFWGSYGNRDPEGWSSAMNVFNTLANTTYLTQVTLTSLAELAAPFTQSGFAAAGKATARRSKDYRFSKMTSFKHNDSFERELEALLKTGTQGRGKYQKFDNLGSNFNRRFFNFIRLPQLTKVARNFAYDTGVNRAFDVAAKYKKTGKLSKAIVKEMEELRISADDLKEIGKYTDIRVAFEEGNARSILDMAGRSAADRDAIIPLLGNRLYFSQSNSATIRNLGQFSSWAQAKSVQVNNFANKVESGDAAALMRVALTVPAGVFVNSLKSSVDPNYEGREEKEDSALQQISEGMKATGNFDNWIASKAWSAVKYGSQEGNFLAQAAPAAGWFEGMGKALSDAKLDYDRGDYEGSFKEILDEVPGFRQALKAYKGITGEQLLIDEPNVDEKKYVPRLNKGGEVLDVPNAPQEPDERIDKMTGMPYDQQAGTAFVDEEDPLRRLGFVGGGNVDPLRRLGFGA